LDAFGNSGGRRDGAREERRVGSRAGRVLSHAAALVRRLRLRARVARVAAHWRGTLARQRHGLASGFGGSGLGRDMIIASKLAPIPTYNYCYWALIPADATTFFHFAMSAATMVANSSGVPVSGSAP